MLSNVRIRLGMLAGACAIGAAVLAISTRSRQPEVRPGTAVLALQQEGIRSITYRAGAMTLTAHRISAEPFAVQVAYSDGRAAENCQASQDLAGLLPDLGEIDARRQLTPKQLASEFPIDAGTVEMEDNVDEPIPPLAVRMALNRSAVAVVYSGQAVEVNVSPEVFEKLAKGCAALAGDQKVVKLWPQR